METKEMLENAEHEEEQNVLPKTYGVEHIANESIIFFGKAEYKRKSYRMFYGIGYVYRVVKGEKCDLIYINFGMFPNMRPRLVVALDNRARRQTLTLKRGQLCQVYGLCRNYTTYFEYNGEQHKRVRMGLFARGLNGWYIPTMLEINKMPVNEDVVEISENEKKLEDLFEDVLDSFMNGNGESE